MARQNILGKFEEKSRITLFCISLSLCVHTYIAVRRLCKFLCLSIFNKIVFLQIYCSIILRNRRKWVTKEHTLPKRPSLRHFLELVFFSLCLFRCHFIHSNERTNKKRNVYRNFVQGREKISFWIYSRRLEHQSENDWMFFITLPSAVCSTITV